MSLDYVRTEYGWRHWCENCGKAFESKRQDAKTCSATCRTQIKRREEAKRRLRAEVQATLRRFIVMAEDEPTEENKEVFMRLYKQIQDALI